MNAARVIARIRTTSAVIKLRGAIAAALVCAVLSPLPADAATNPKFRRIGSGTPVLQRVQALLKSDRVKSDAIAENVALPGLVIPAAGNAPGAHGTYFKSDVTLVNMREVDQRVVIAWLPNGAPDNGVEFEGTLPKGWPVTFVDFVGTELELTGVGALVILPVDAAGEIDEEGRIDASSRIWSPSADGAAGTFSQPLPALDIMQFFNSLDALMLGLRQDEGFRTNYGIVNLSEFDQMFYVRVIGESGTEVAEDSVLLKAGEMVLRPLPAGNLGKISVLVSVDELFASSPLIWTAFTSSTDNGTGDGWVAVPSKVTREWVRDRHR